MAMAAAVALPPKISARQWTSRKGYLVRKASPNDRRSQLLYPTEKAESLKSSKAEIEAEFYEYLTSALPADEAAAFAATLHKLYTASKTESRAGFPYFHKTDGEMKA